MIDIGYHSLQGSVDMLVMPMIVQIRALL